ncbi:MAG: bacillithiol biosynthesis cysteine-adding enzyme BshC, partial [bacterium]|nr:bacillithiol biosynthesis cysteine-adding enzyme BshC [bacterium]
MPEPAPRTTVWSMLKAPANAPAAALPHDWLRYHPAQIEACVEARGARLPEPLAPGELDELRSAHARWGADAGLEAAVETLGRPGTRVVVTGQQPAPLAGPLLTLYKTIGAIGLARRLTERHPGLTFTPVFWIASEDHDFDEIRRVFWPGHTGQLEEYLLHPNGWEPGQMIGEIQTHTMLAPLL